MVNYHLRIVNQHRKANAFPDRRVPGDPRLLDAIQRRTPNIAGGSVTHVFGSTILTPARQRKVAGGGSSGPCPFGEIITYKVGDDDKTGIRGGTIKAGDKNFNVENKDLNLSGDGKWLVSIKLQVECNRDDDNEAILGGVKTSGSSPTWDTKAWSTGTDYDDDTNPVVSTGLGTIVIPLGKLTIADDVATFEKTGCGNITVEQCNGTLDHTRG